MRGIGDEGRERRKFVGGNGLIGVAGDNSVHPAVIVRCGTMLRFGRRRIVIINGVAPVIILGFRLHLKPLFFNKK